MNSILRGLGIVVVFAVFMYVSNTKMITKQIRDLLGPETPTALQIEMKESRDRLKSSFQYNPPITRYETPEWLKKELNK